MTACGKRVALVPLDHGLVRQLSVRRNGYMGRLDDHGALRNLARLIHLPRGAPAAIDAVIAPLGLAEFAARFDTAAMAPHDVDLAHEFATWIIGLQGGRIRFDAAAMR